MRFVELRRQAQLDIQILHRVRGRLIGERTSLMNQIRSVFLERGHIVPQGKAKLALRLTELLAEPAVKLSSHIRELVCDMHKRWQALDERNGAFDKQFIEYARHDEHARGRITIPGIGALNATALARPSAMHVPSPAAVISPHGSASCHAKRRPATSRGSLVSPSVGANIFEKC
jgi:transposase